MDRELKTALGVVAGVVGLIFSFIALIRYAVPFVLSARFGASLPVAAVLAVVGILALSWAGWTLWRWAARRFNGQG